MANQFLGLSLFIMLLSFFIILNAISSFEDTKSKPVLNSISMTFSNQQTVEDALPGKMVVKNNTQNQEGSTLDRIEAAFQSQIATAETKQNRLGTMMFMRMPFDDFNKGIKKSLVIAASSPTATLENDDLDLLPMLVSLMETSRDVSYTMDMILNIEEEPSFVSTNDPQRFAALNKSISSIALKLEEAGLPKYQVTSGLKQGEAGVVDLVFRRYLPFSPVGIENQTTSQDAETESSEAQPDEGG